MFKFLASIFGGGAPSISTGEVLELIASNRRPILLDVRTLSEHRNSNISGSIHIPLDQLSSRVGDLEGFKEEEIVVYCQSGMRSSMACRKLAERGFKVKNLSGGMNAWRRQG